VSALVRILTAFLIAITGIALLPAGAHAHADLVRSTPEDGENLQVAPDQIVLTFNEELFEELIEVSILDASGDLVMATEAEQTPPPGTDVFVPWPADLPPGEYSVAFRVVSEDGHPVTGQIAFSYDAVASPPTPEPSETLEPEVIAETPSDAPSPQPEPISQEPSPETTSSQASEVAVAIEEAGQPNSSLIGPLLIGAAVVVGIGVVFSLVMLARSRQ